MHNLNRGNKYVNIKMWAYSVIFTKLPKVGQLGENSPNLVTLARNKKRFEQKKIPGEV
jgi:hypothetical protein